MAIRSYTEVLRRHGGGFAVGTMVPVPSGDFLVFNIERRYEDGPVPRQVVTTLDRIRPHLARAALVSARLRLERARTTVEVLRQVGLPAAAIERDGRVLAANGLLEKLAGQFLFAARDRLRLCNPLANGLFERALAQMEAGRNNEAMQSIPVQGTDDSPPLILHLLPVRGAAHDVLSGAFFLLIATAVTRPGAPPSDLLNGLFDLAPAEARIAALVGSGLAPREAAQRLGITEQTARTALKRVFSKVGVSRQSELAALLTRLVLR
jgi:DNA-binding CsgD family transcriptional regulator